MGYAGYVPAKVAEVCVPRVFCALLLVQKEWGRERVSSTDCCQLTATARANRC